ncbi:hypothetical protein KFE25_006556 [Diacronema lutheri]|uniref:Apple domain-containing protein n=1 Tax=Diacronema lutheri TaxID=2081491 RepID=A0A8J5X2B0_DIALT|nr:hypothetical protein KFE25_006556 [Diacronema lutheri]
MARVERSPTRGALVTLGVVCCVAVVLLVAQGEAPQLEAVHARLAVSARPLSRQPPHAPQHGANATAGGAGGAQAARGGRPPMAVASPANASGVVAGNAAFAGRRGGLRAESLAPLAAAGGAADGGVGARLATAHACVHHAHAGFDGSAFTWGMSFKTATAQECCEACQAHASICSAPGSHGARFWRARLSGALGRCGKQGVGCNVFVHCPTPLCWANDIHNHTFGECWLKRQLDPARPRSPALGAYPPPYRRKHRTAPERVQWQSGALVPAGTVLAVDGPHWRWRRR